MNRVALKNSGQSERNGPCNHDTHTGHGDKFEYTDTKDLFVEQKDRYFAKANRESTKYLDNPVALN